LTIEVGLVTFFLTKGTTPFKLLSSLDNVVEEHAKALAITINPLEKCIWD